MGLMQALLAPKAISESEVRGPLAWLMDVGGGRKTRSGIQITEDNLITLSAVFACVRNISEDIAKLPLKLYRDMGEDGREAAKDNALYYLMHTEPNEEMTAFDFRQALIGNALLWGGGFAEIERTGGGEPVALWPILKRRVKPKRDNGGTLYYEVRNDNGPPSEIPMRDMIHVKGFSLTGIVGLMIHELGAESFGVYLAAEQFCGTFFGNGANSNGIIEMEGKLSPESLASYRQQFSEVYAGVANSHKPIVLDNKAKFNKITMEPEKSQLVETLQFRTEDVSRWFRMPPHKIQQLLRATFSNIEHQALEYVTDTLMSWLERTEQEFDRKLVGTARGALYFEHNVDAMLRGDAKSRAEALQIQFQNGTLTPDEWRATENRNPLPDGKGKTYFVMANLQTMDRAITAPAPTPPQALPAAEQPADAADDAAAEASSLEASKRALMPVFVVAAERIVAREVKAVRGKGNFSQTWLASFYAGHGNVITASMEAPIEALAKIAKKDAAGLAERYAARHVEQSLSELRGAATSGAGFGADWDAVERVLDKWTAERPATIAQQLTDEVCNG